MTEYSIRLYCDWCAHSPAYSLTRHSSVVSLAGALPPRRHSVAGCPCSVHLSHSKLDVTHFRPLPKLQLSVDDKFGNRCPVDRIKLAAKLQPSFKFRQLLVKPFDCVSSRTTPSQHPSDPVDCAEIDLSAHTLLLKDPPGEGRGDATGSPGVRMTSEGGEEGSGEGGGWPVHGELELHVKAEGLPKEMKLHKVAIAVSPGNHPVRLLCARDSLQRHVADRIFLEEVRVSVVSERGRWVRGKELSLLAPLLTVSYTRVPTTDTVESGSTCSSPPSKTLSVAERMVEESYICLHGLLWAEPRRAGSYALLIHCAAENENSLPVKPAALTLTLTPGEAAKLDLNYRLPSMVGVGDTLLPADLQLFCLDEYSNRLPLPASASASVAIEGSDTTSPFFHRIRLQNDFMNGKLILPSSQPMPAAAPSGKYTIHFELEGIAERLRLEYSFDYLSEPLHEEIRCANAKLEGLRKEKKGMEFKMQRLQESKASRDDQLKLLQKKLQKDQQLVEESTRTLRQLERERKELPQVELNREASFSGYRPGAYLEASRWRVDFFVMAEVGYVEASDVARAIEGLIGYRMISALFTKSEREQQELFNVIKRAGVGDATVYALTEQRFQRNLRPRP
ncbi:MAG: hypothetical protein SGPRY_000651 [Prymnesium sp.]